MGLYWTEGDFTALGVMASGGCISAGGGLVNDIDGLLETVLCANDCTGRVSICVWLNM